MPKYSCSLKYTVGGKSVGSAYGEDRADNPYNTVTLKYYPGGSTGTKWDANTSLSKITFRAYAGLTKKTSTFDANDTVTTQWYIELTCNNTTVRCPSSGTKSGTYECHDGLIYEDQYDDKPINYPDYCQFTFWDQDNFSFSITDPTFLAGLVAGKNITLKYYFPNNSNYCIIKNASIKITSWSDNIAPVLSVSYPNNNTTTYNPKPYYQISGTDANNDTLAYSYSFDNSTWYNATSGKKSTQRLSKNGANLTPGNYNVYFRVSDGINTTKILRKITVDTATIEEDVGSKINANTMNYVRTKINNLQDYYGYSTKLNEITPGSKITTDHINDVYEIISRYPKYGYMPHTIDSDTLCDASTISGFNNYLRNS